MNKKILIVLAVLSSLFAFAVPLRAQESSSPYDKVIGVSKTGNSIVDAILDAGKEVNKIDSTKLADYLKSLSAWKKLSEKAQNYINGNIGKLGPLVKKLGWIMNALDLAPSVYQTVTAFKNRDKKSFKDAFRDVTLKTGSIVTGLAIGAGVSAAIPVVVAATAATGGGALVVAAIGVVVSVGGGMLVDHLAKTYLSKTIENFAGKLYDNLIKNDTLSILNSSGVSGGGGGKGGGDGPVKLDALKW